MKKKNDEKESVDIKIYPDYVYSPFAIGTSIIMIGAFFYFAYELISRLIKGKYQGSDIGSTIFLIVFFILGAFMGIYVFLIVDLVIIHIDEDKVWFTRGIVTKKKIKVAYQQGVKYDEIKSIGYECKMFPGYKLPNYKTYLILKKENRRNVKINTNWYGIETLVNVVDLINSRIRETGKAYSGPDGEKLFEKYLYKKRRKKK